ncbi:MAG: ribosome maturation factor [Coriobacteriaceae bacterium]|nr:ribosome maturation factor [Coriobacteriaceae bacterium]
MGDPRFFCSGRRNVPGKDLDRRITELLDPEAARHGIELVAVEVTAGHGQPTVRVYLDRPGGVDIDVIAQANRWIEAVLEADEPIRGAYTLEVSSPGIERPLVKLADFERFAGQPASVRLDEPLDGRAKFSGTIQGVDGDTVLLASGDETFRLPFGHIAKARLKPEIDFSQHEQHEGDLT